MAEPSHISGVPEEAVRVQLERILQSPGFVRSKQLASFLRFIVEGTLDGNSENLKGYVIAIDVLGRRDSFDPKLSTIVRSEARRLRAKLAEYYYTASSDEPVEIRLPKGSYVPKFELRGAGEPEEPPQRVIAGYEILEEIEGGGMGSVFRAHDPRLRRTVALKLLPAPPGGAESSGDQTPDALAAALDHPNVCTVYEVGVADGQPFIVSAYIVGEDLACKIERGRLELADVLELGIQVAEGLVAAHAHSVVHCDLKPSNILIASDGPKAARVKIIDFGIAQQKRPTSPVELTERFGTLAYMSPEQLDGDELDGRSDIWSLGVVLYEALTGRLPFHGANSKTLRLAILHQELRMPDDPELEVDPAMERLLRRCLEKAPGDRYQSADGLLDHLRSLLAATESEPSPADSAGTDFIQKPVTPSRRRWLLLFAGILAVALAVFVGFRLGSKSPPLQARQFLLDPMVEDELVGVTISPDGRSVAYVTGVRTERRLWVRELSNNTVRDLGPIDNQEAAWCPESDHLAYRQNGMLVKASTKGTSPPAVIAELPDAVIARFAWTEDGSEIFFFTPSYKPLLDKGIGRRLWKVPEVGGEPEVVMIHPVEKRHLRELHFIPGTDSRLLLASALSDGVWVIDVESGEAIRVSNGHRAVYSPTGHILVVQQGDLWAIPWSLKSLSNRKGITVAL